MITNDASIDQPVILRSLDFRGIDGAKDEVNWILDSCRGLYHGSLEFFRDFSGCPILEQSIRTLAKELGCSSLEEDHPDGSGILPIKGSIHAHKDNLPILLTWAAYVDYPDHRFYPRPELIWKDQHLRVTVGDVFLFDPQEQHAWLHNGTAVFVQLPVKISERTFKEVC